MDTADMTDLEERIRTSFAKQGLPATLGAVMTHVEPGRIVIELTPRPALSQQNGFVHAGAVTTIMDSACGYAALSMIPADADALTVEFKVNLLRPATGVLLRAVGRVVKPGRTITFCQAECVAVADDGTEKLVATMTNTVMAIKPNE